MFTLKHVAYWLIKRSLLNLVLKLVVGKVCVSLQGVSVINEKCPTVSGFPPRRIVGEKGEGAQGLKITGLEEQCAYIIL